MSADIAAISETVKEYSKESSAGKQLYTGYIALEGNVLKINDFEFIESEHGDRIKELGLTAKDMPNGYYILNTSEDIKDFAVDDNTEYFMIQGLYLYRIRMAIESIPRRASRNLWLFYTEMVRCR